MAADDEDGRVTWAAFIAMTAAAVLVVLNFSCRVGIHNSASSPPSTYKRYVNEFAGRRNVSAIQERLLGCETLSLVSSDATCCTAT